MEWLPCCEHDRLKRVLGGRTGLSTGVLPDGGMIGFRAAAMLTGLGGGVFGGFVVQLQHLQLRNRRKIPFLSSLGVLSLALVGFRRVGNRPQLRYAKHSNPSFGNLLGFFNVRF